jgi:site-specific DNA-methyltransferase (adenine-specific)
MARRGSRTNAFGSPARIAHDATPFYSRRLYEGLPKEEPVAYREIPLPPECVNRIFCKSSERMEELPDCSVHLMVTSPPYNVGKEYDDNLTLDEYRAFLRRVMAEVYRVLVPGGRACINFGKFGAPPLFAPPHLRHPRHAGSGLFDAGRNHLGQGVQPSPSTAWGSWCSPQNPTLRDTHEYILVFCKQTFSRPNSLGRKPTINRDELLEFTKSVGRFSAEPATKVGHPAPFPVELPYRLIQLYTFEGEVVLDPFIGSGTTAIAH